MRPALTSVLLAAIWAGAASCGAPESTPRPEPRPAEVAATPGERARAAATGAAQAGAVGEMLRALGGSPRPEVRPALQAREPGTGALCGDPAIIGTALPPIRGRLTGCGIEAPVQVRSVSGVALSQAATLDCATASALRKWLDGAVKPAMGQLGGGVTGLRVAAHYVCRTRNNRPGGKISEHGRGRAIDISAFRLRNGAEVSVLDGWRDRRIGPVLRQVHQAACGPFGTVLGPEADAYHQDHFHFDTARYRRGRYCK